MGILNFFSCLTSSSCRANYFFQNNFWGPRWIFQNKVVACVTSQNHMGNITRLSSQPRCGCERCNRPPRSDCLQQQQPLGQQIPRPAPATVLSARWEALAMPGQRDGPCPLPAPLPVHRSPRTASLQSSSVLRRVNLHARLRRSLRGGRQGRHLLFQDN